MTICNYCNKNEVIEDMGRCDSCMDLKSQRVNYILHNTGKINQFAIVEIVDFYDNKMEQYKDSEQLIKIAMKKFGINYKDAKVVYVIVEGKSKEYNKYKKKAEKIIMGG